LNWRFLKLSLFICNWRLVPPIHCSSPCGSMISTNLNNLGGRGGGGMRRCLRMDPGGCETKSCEHENLLVLEN
jgi:hypothetical protein